MIVEHVLTTETTVPDLATFRKRYPDAEIVRIDGLVYRGRCESCGKPILGNELHYSYGDGIKLCSECGA